MERLQKYLARCGVASRRKAEELIAQGHVKVNQQIVTEMGIKVSSKDNVMVDDVLVEALELKYFVMNKPRYVISAVDDDKNRKTVISILPESFKKYHLFPVGRLDYDTKGVLLLTNDGTFMNQLVGPQSLLEKEYLVRVTGIISKETIKKLSNGVEIDGRMTRKCKVYVESYDNTNLSSLVGVVLQEGKYHQIKKMFAAVGHNVKRLTRIRFGNIYIDQLQEGDIRELSIHEIKQLLVLSNTEQDYSEKKVRTY